MELELIKQIAFFIYCFIIPFLLTIVGISLIYLKLNK